MLREAVVADLQVEGAARGRQRRFSCAGTAAEAAAGMKSCADPRP
jgi:hypothetical protein